jgi:hypothetical protein
MRKTALKVVLAVIAVVYLSVPWPAKASEPDDRQAMDILQKMSKTLAEAEQFSVTLKCQKHLLRQNSSA